MAVTEKIFAHARSTPEKTAAISNGRTISYRSFAGAIAQARRFLDAQAIGRDRPAVMFVNDLMDAWVVGLALRSLGVTTVQGRSTDDIERLGLGAVSVVASAQVISPDLEAAAAKAGAPLIAVPAEALAAAMLVGEDFPMSAARPGGHILLTSGTTGVYKKALIDPANAARNIERRANVFQFNAASVVDVFDFGGWTGLGYSVPICIWQRGGAVVLHQGPERWRSLAAPGLTTTYTHPQLLAELLATPAEISQRNDAMALVVAGGPLSPALWRAARERLTLDVRTSIGVTEIGLVLMTRIETEADLAWHAIDPAISVQVVDDHDRPLPAGETGLVRIRTTGVDGYLDDPETSRAFFRDGYFHPGDLGVVRADGRLSLQGRVTDVINVMGHKIATGPIEAVLQDRLGAQAVCVFSVPGAGGEEVHVAVQPGRTISAAELKAALLEALPDVAAAQVHAVKGFPRNHMGKIERARLKAQLLSSG